MKRSLLLLILLFASVFSLGMMSTAVASTNDALLLTATPSNTPVVAGTIVPIISTEPPVEFLDRSDPASLLAAYFNAINRQDYARAYSYWEQEPNGATLEQFAAGYAQTAHVDAYTLLPETSDGAAGSSYAQLPVLIIATQTDGRQQNFVGCYTARKSNVPTGNNTEPDPNWWLYDGSLFAYTTAQLNLLHTACETPTTIAMQGAFDFAESPIYLLESYFNAIARGEYARAYAYWEQEPSGATLEQFTAGFAQTREIYVYVRLEFTSEGAAGSVYTTVPTMVLAWQTDGSQRFFGGCYVARKSNVPTGNNTEPDPNWRLYDAQVSQAANLNDAVSLMACNQ